jgi:hypothetical protein
MIVVTVLLGSRFIELPVALSQEEQPKLPTSVDFTSTKFTTLITAAEPTSTSSEPAAPPVFAYGLKPTGVIKAQPVAPLQTPLTPRRSRLLVALYVSHGALQLLDAASTLRAVGPGSAREANPLMQPLVAHPPAFIAFKAGIGAGIIYGTHRFSEHHPRAAILIMSVINGGYLYLVQRNFRIAAQRR